MSDAGTVPADASRFSSHPAIAEGQAARAAKVELRVADAITKFAGSMRFVYIHALVFAVWCSTGLFGADKFPFNFLTMTVSLEAIFLSTFVMIGQNRQAEFAQRKAEHDFVEEEQELHLNTAVTQAIHELVREIHVHLHAGADPSADAAAPPSTDTATAAAAGPDPSPAS